MKRYLSVWLPRWPVERRFTARPPLSGNRQENTGARPEIGGPLVLSMTVHGAVRVTAVNDAAAELGLAAGMSLADARAIHPALAVAQADEAGDAAALRRLALWCQRYSPLTRVDPPDGLCIDITGCAHLFGGEEALAWDLASRLRTFGLSPRLAIASTIGAAWAVARHGDTALESVEPGQTGVRLAALPVAGLRIEAATVQALGRLGLERIGLVAGKPRAPLASRFGAMLVRRLDQALGHESERFDPLSPPPAHFATLRFAEPVVTLEAIAQVTERLVGELAATLGEAGKAARRLELALFRVDGWRELLELRISRPSNDPRHLSRLLGERLDRIRDHAGFGFEVAVLAAFDVENAEEVQSALVAGGGADADPDGFARLLDRFVNRLGPASVTRFAPNESYLPERAVRPVSVLVRLPAHDWPAHCQALCGAAGSARPALLLERPEPVEVIVEMPDKPPARFEWRRVSHRVARADGPERIAPEWWKGGEENRFTRDYYRIEDGEGRRFWLFREGLYDRDGDRPRWFMHGLFA
ncbi:Y-family DNA polymerase [Stappia sp.]|uniref:Y-family DNA polymerase n=1 Tax=Stappia sp. TaxID=1870903 RepID=UPI003A992F98